MKVSSVNRSYCVSQGQNCTPRNTNFKATLYVDHAVEKLIAQQAYESSHGDNDKFRQLIKDFAQTMIDLKNKIKPLPGLICVALHPELALFLNEPPKSRGVYYGPQLALIPELPILGTELLCYPFTYSPYKSGLVDELYNASKALISKHHGIV